MVWASVNLLRFISGSLNWARVYLKLDEPQGATLAPADAPIVAVKSAIPWGFLVRIPALAVTGGSGLSRAKSAGGGSIGQAEADSLHRPKRAAGPDPGGSVPHLEGQSRRIRQQFLYRAGDRASRRSRRHDPPGVEHAGLLPPEWTRTKQAAVDMTLLAQNRVAEARWPFALSSRPVSPIRSDSSPFSR